jgi:hypothetical protein
MYEEHSGCLRNQINEKITPSVIIPLIADSQFSFLPSISNQAGASNLKILVKLHLRQLHYGFLI